MANEHTGFKVRGRGKGLSHADYIAGNGKFGTRPDVIFCVDENLPIWAKNGADFWLSADLNERANGRVYTELEWSIPREAEDPVKWAQDAAQDIFGKDYVYRLAIHNKPASDGLPNPHLHLMFSERQLDGIQRETPKHFFKKGNAKNPERGGVAKNREWNSREMPGKMREKYKEHVRRVVPDFDFAPSEFPEEKIGPAVPKAGKFYKKKREQRQKSVSELRRAKAEISILETAIKGENMTEITFSENTKKIATDIAAALKNKFGGGGKNDYLSVIAPPHAKPSNSYFQIAGYSNRDDGGDIMYFARGNSEPVLIDRRNGKQIDVMSYDEYAILSSLRLAQKKWGSFDVVGDGERMKICNRCLAGENLGKLAAMTDVEISDRDEKPNSMGVTATNYFADEARKRYYKVETEAGEARAAAEKADNAVETYRAGNDINGFLASLRRMARQQNVRARDAGNYQLPELDALEQTAEKAKTLAAEARAALKQATESLNAAELKAREAESDYAKVREQERKQQEAERIQAAERKQQEAERAERDDYDGPSM